MCDYLRELLSTGGEQSTLGVVSRPFCAVSVWTVVIALKLVLLLQREAISKYKVLEKKCEKRLVVSDGRFPVALW